jgi:4-hydroxy-tetrahydrodipicolinate synthase
MQNSDVKMSGISYMMPTPFRGEGDIDFDSIDRLIEFCIAKGADGFTVLGVAGEAAKLSHEERMSVLRHAMGANAKRLQVVVGVSGDDVEEIIELSNSARELGAEGVMIAPHKDWLGSFDIPDKLIEVCSKIKGLEITLQDYPDATGVNMTTDDIVRVVDNVDSISSIKLESLPSPARMEEVIEALPRQCSMVGGLGGLYFFYELQAGAVGAMTGFAFPEILKAIQEAYSDGRHEAARKIYNEALPLLVFEGQPKVGLAIRKETLVRRGIIESAQLRSPSAPLATSTTRGLRELLSSFGY